MGSARVRFGYHDSQPTAMPAFANSTESFRTPRSTLRSRAATFPWR